MYIIIDTMSKLLVFIQIGLLLILFLLADIEFLLNKPVLIIVLIIGAFIGLSGFFNFDKRSFSIFPQPTENNKLTTKGIYKYIRHPMYTGLMIVSFALMLSQFSTLSIIVYIFLLIILDIKAAVEEKLLTKKHKEYKDYKKNSKMFIPCLY